MIARGDTTWQGGGNTAVVRHVADGYDDVVIRRGQPVALFHRVDPKLYVLPTGVGPWNQEEGGEEYRRRGCNYIGELEYGWRSVDG